MKKTLGHWIATCGPIGEMRVAPGSFGSLVAIPLILLTSHHAAVFAFLLGVVFFVSVWSSHVAARDLGQHDPASVVIDEVCGMMVSFLFVPVGWKVLILGFIGFRFFDIVKPPPIRFCERFPSGFGIVLDDVMAGIYTNLLLQALIHYAHL